MFMNDDAVVCDVCNVMEGPEPFIELWPAGIRGPYGPGRVYVEAFHACLDCIRRRLAADRIAAIARDARHSQNAWREFGKRERARGVAEAAGRDRELGLGGAA